MELNLNKKKLPTHPNKLSNPGEMARILRQYAGIFPNNIKEFGELVVPKLKKRKNFAK